MASADCGQATPTLVGGVLAAHAPTFADGGSRLFAACGTSVFCYSARTARQLAAFASHRGHVTAVCSGTPRPDCASPLATGTELGEVCLWDSKSRSCLGSLDFEGMPVHRLFWPKEDTLLVVLGQRGQRMQIERVELASLSTPRRAGNVPVDAAHAGDVDVVRDVIALADGSSLRVWSERWGKSCKYPHRHALTAVCIDPSLRYVAVGDENGVVWTWWGGLEDGTIPTAPARWHWHAHPVRALVHCGPLMLSGGDEGVLCIRNAEEDTVRFVPRLGAPLKHLAACATGRQVCVSLENNSLALLNELHGWMTPRWIHAVDVPVSMLSGQSSCSAVGRERGPVLHALAHGGIALTGSGQRVQFLDAQGSVSQTLTMNRGNYVCPADNEPLPRWSLFQVVFNASATCIMTCESRTSPALERFDKQSAQSCVLKWWRRGDDGHYAEDTVVHNPHMADVTVALSHPLRDNFFITASFDGTFKTWDRADKCDPKSCWQLMSLGNWHSRPILCGCNSADGSALALGFHGFVVLWEADTAAEIHTLALSEPTDEVVQLSSVVACQRFLLLGSSRGQNGRHELLCWDLVRLEIIARLDLSASFRGNVRCAVRFSTPSHGNCPLHVLAFRPPASELKAWKLAPGEAGLPPGFTSEATYSVPYGHSVLDAIFLGTDARLLYWTSIFELWDFSLSGEGVSQPEALPAEEEQEQASGKIARVLGRPTRGDVDGKILPFGEAPVQLLTFPLRTTAEQQAGIIPSLLEHVVPPQVPTHLLPPPSVMWTGLLAVFGKPLPDASLTPEVYSESAGNGKAATATQGGCTGTTMYEASDDLPPWVSASRLRSAEPDRSELVDIAFMDQLVQDALK
mmetsp:Transcript_75604/g.162096  ORF Transcript_75604/g.162096 Transcript_75604/m.162096 type:complete len:856 (+) Transcript_75604:33-2600(+)